MSTFKLSIRPMIYGLLLGTVYLGLGGLAMAWNEPLWVRQIGTVEGDSADGVASDSAGNVFIAGVTEGSLAGPQQGAGDAWVAKYSAIGALRWKLQLGTSKFDFARAVATDGAGNVYIAGETIGSLAGPHQGKRDAWVAKYSTTGTLRWKQQLGTSKEDVPYGVAPDTAGNVFIAGMTDGSLAGPQQGAGDAWVAKYSTAGALRWKQQLGTSASEWATGVATDGVGNVFIAGNSVGDFVNGGWDGWVAKYSPAGALRWKQQYAWDEQDSISAVTADSDDNAYIAGLNGGDTYVAKISSGGTLLWIGLGPFFVCCRAEPDTISVDQKRNIYVTGMKVDWIGGRGFNDAYAAKFLPTGLLDWARTLDNSPNDQNSGIATVRDDVGNVYIAGPTEGGDAFVAKYSTRR